MEVNEEFVFMSNEHNPFITINRTVQGMGADLLDFPFRGNSICMASSGTSVIHDSWFFAKNACIKIAVEIMELISK